MAQNRFFIEDGDGRQQHAHPTTTQDGTAAASVGGGVARKDSKTVLAELPRQQVLRPLSAGSGGQSRPGAQASSGQGQGHKAKSSLGNLGRLAGVGVGGPMRKMKK